ncbi:hypothetical protein BDZ91DRAFT_400374 [Kalaharituber pfeilii]|nr:hypothetical protein BDZ91DRAFT_400374 [Kalaharituber pfeilii]
MSDRETAADEAYEAAADEEDVPTGVVVDNSYAISEPAGVSVKQGTGPGGAVGADTVNPVIRDEEEVEDPIDPAKADSDEMLAKDEKEAINKSNILSGSRTRFGGDKTVDYTEPGDEEGMPPPEDGSSSLRTGRVNLT